MQLYKFSLSSFNGKVAKEVLEAEERPKTYTITEDYWKRRISKSDIGHINVYGKVYLLEDDEKKVREIFCEKLRDDIHAEQRRIKNAEEEIEKLENLIKQLRED